MVYRYIQRSLPLGPVAPSSHLPYDSIWVLSHGHWSLPSGLFPWSLPINTSLCTHIPHIATYFIPDMTVHLFLIIRPLGITSSRKCEVVSVHAMKHIGGTAIKLHLFSTSAMQEGSVQFHVQTALYPDNNPSIHWIEGWVGCSAGLEVSEWKLSQNAP
jgi:hypothetical protein